MSGLRSFAVSSEETAALALDYFNGFHDGFMQRIVFESQDRIGNRPQPALHRHVRGRN